MNDPDRAQTEKHRLHRPDRKGVVTLLLILASVLAFFAAFAVWVDRQALNTDNWTDTSTKLIENEEIRDAVAEYAVNQLFANVDVAKEIEDNAPKDFKGPAEALSGPAAAGVRQLADEIAPKALAQPRIQGLWEQANREAHKQLLLVIDDRSEIVKSNGGEVVLDLAGLVKAIADQIGVGSDIADAVPKGAAQLTILKSDQLGLVRNVVDLIRGLAIVLTVLAIFLYALAVYVAKGRRRETLRAVGIGLAIVGILVLVVRGLAGTFVTDALAQTAASEPAAESAWTIATELLSSIAASAIVTGIMLVLAAWIGGPTKVAIGLRRAAAPYLREKIAISYGVVAAILLLFIVWAPTINFRSPINWLLYAVLLVIGVEVLRRETAREFPGEQAGVPIASAGEAFERVKGAISKGAATLGGAVSKMRTDSGKAADGRIARLERLGELKQKGLLTDEEFETEKTAILESAD